MKFNGGHVFNFFLYLFMTGVIVVTLYPFWTQIMISLTPKDAPPVFNLLQIPKRISFDGYLLIFQYKAVWVGYANTILRTVLGVTLSLVFTALVAYPLSKASLPFNRTFTFLILFTMMFSGGLIPSYMLVKELHLMNSIWALVLPGMVEAFNVLIMRNFFRSLPESLEESARIDGAGYVTIFRTIVLPLSKPVLATVALWVGVQVHWNGWFDAMIYINDPNKQVLQIVLRKIIFDNNVQTLKQMMTAMGSDSKFSGPQLQATMIMFSVIPLLLAYPFVQKYFVRGIMVGAIKG